MEESTSLVIDNGSGMMKAGYSGDDTPRVIFPTVIGKPKSAGAMVGMEQKDIYIGQEALSKKDNLNLEYPIIKGVIENMEHMQAIWSQKTFSDLRVLTEENPIMMTESPQNPVEKREELLKIMFEEFNVPAFFLASQAVLSLFSSGKTTGIVLSAGYGITHTVPVYEGYAIPHAIQPIELAGKDLNDYFQKLLVAKGKGYEHLEYAEPESISSAKEKCCLVAEDYDSWFKEAKEHGKHEITHRMPDQKEITIASERFMCPELLFQPNLDGREHDGVHKSIHDSIMKCDVDIRKDLYANISLSGGSSMFEGIKVRMKKELQALAPSSADINLIVSPERKYNAWIGGSILSSIGAFKPMWISKNEYKDSGLSIIHKKCF